MSERPLYEKTEALIQVVSQWKGRSNKFEERFVELFVELYERNFIEIKDVHLAQKWIRTLQQMRYQFPTIANETVGMVKRPRTITSSSSQPQKPVQTHVETTRTWEQKKSKIIQLPITLDTSWFPSYPQCANLTLELMADIVTNIPDKGKYFEQIRRYTDLTSRQFEVSQKKVLPSAVFIGDSITAEIMKRYKLISPQTKVDFWYFKVGFPEMSDKILSQYGVVFIGANSLHMALRGTYEKCLEWGLITLQGEGNTHKWCKKEKLKALESHHQISARVVNYLDELRHRTGKRVVLITTFSVDDQYFLLPETTHKPRQWDLFHDFRLVDLWADIDTKLCKKYNITVFDARMLAHECPGVRCDGMHYGSDFEKFGCRRSDHLWDKMLVAFAEKYLLNHDSN